MKTKKIEKLLKKESTLVLSDIKYDIKNNHFGYRTKTKSRWSSNYLFIPFLATVALLIGFIVIPLRNATTYIVVAINPQIQIALNSKDKIINVEGLNVDGVVLTYDEEFKGLELEAGIAKLMALYNEFGFLDSNPDINLLSYNKNDFKETDFLTRSAQAVQNYINNNSLNSNINRINQAQRSREYLQNIMITKGYNQPDINALSIRQMLRISANYDQDSIKAMISTLKNLKQSIINLPPQQRRAALILIKRGQFPGNRPD